ncbi:MAG: hypothetical protein BJ554DRAFT_7069, partial [Olpidium bornovanus]
MELGDPVTLSCEKTDLVAEIDFKTKGFFSGSYNHIGGKVKRISTGEILSELSGKWTDVMYIKRGGQQEVFFDAHDTPICAKIVAREDQQHWNESRKLWSKVTAAIVSRNLELATEEKSKIEDAQRHVAKEREAEGIDWKSKYFVPVGNEYLPSIARRDEYGDVFLVVLFGVSHMWDSAYLISLRSLSSHIYTTATKKEK